MKKTVPILSAVDDDDAPELSAELRLAFEDIAELAREGLLAMSVGVGLRVMVEMMENELTEVVGPKNAKLPDRSASRHASAPGSVALGGRRVPMSRPRARTTGDTEVALDTYATFTNDDLLTRVVLERMLAGVATPAPPGRGRARGQERGGDGPLHRALLGVEAVQGVHSGGDG